VVNDEFTRVLVTDKDAPVMYALVIVFLKRTAMENDCPQYNEKLDCNWPRLL
jgi:hypothetical protein